MSTTKEKPPTQVAGVQGFNAFRTPADDIKKTNLAPKVDWVKLAGLPPFAMFASEIYGVTTSNLTPFINEMFQKTQGSIYQEYCDWHAAKGYWKGETPMGEVIGEVANA